MIFDDRKRKLAEAQERRKAQHAHQQCGEQNDSKDLKQLDISSGMGEDFVIG